MTVAEIETQIENLIKSLSDPSEYEIDGAVKIKNKVSDKISAINALRLQIAELEDESSSPTDLIDSPYY